jgi:hypothetical protein
LEDGPDELVNYSIESGTIVILLMASKAGSVDCEGVQFPTNIEKFLTTITW